MTKRKTTTAIKTSIPILIPQTITEELTFKWLSKNKRLAFFNKDTKAVELEHKEVNCQYLDFDNTDAEGFLSPMIKDLFIGGNSISDIKNLTKDQKSKIVVLFLIQMARYIAPKDNREFLIKVLIHLAKNPLFVNFSTAVKLGFKKLEEGSVNLPALGIFVSPKSSNKYTFVIPKSPTELYFFYVGHDPLNEYTDEELVNFSYGTTNSSVFLHESHSTLSPEQIINIQKTNSAKIGNLAKQMEDPQPLMDIMKSVVFNLPGIKNNFFVTKAVDVAMKFWNKNK